MSVSWIKLKVKIFLKVSNFFLLYMYICFRKHNNFYLWQRNLYRNYSSQLYDFYNPWLRAWQSQLRLWNSIFTVHSWKDDLNTIRALKRLAWSYLSVAPFWRCRSSVSRVEKDVYIIYIIQVHICLSMHRCRLSWLMINAWNVNVKCGNLSRKRIFLFFFLSRSNDAWISCVFHQRWSRVCKLGHVEIKRWRTSLE